MPDFAQTTAAKPNDESIRHNWKLALRLYQKGTAFGQRLGLSIADKLEECG